MRLGKGNTLCSVSETKTLAGKDDGKTQITWRDLKAEKLNLLPCYVSIYGIPVLCKEPVGRAATAPSRPKKAPWSLLQPWWSKGASTCPESAGCKPKNPPARTRRRQCGQLEAMMNGKQRTQAQKRQGCDQDLEGWNTSWWLPIRANNGLGMAMITLSHIPPWPEPGASVDPSTMILSQGREGKESYWEKKKLNFCCRYLNDVGFKLKWLT